MPHTSLLVVTSPFVLGTAPLPATIAIEPVSEPIQSAAAPAIMPLSWSMAQETDPDAQDTASDEENEIVVEGEYGPIEADPMGEFNAESYRITQELDEVFVEPVAYAYRDGLPDPLRDGLGNVVRNLSEPSNFLNYLLQFKFGKAFETLGRFAINSTLGLGGLFDIAAEPGIGLPYRRNGFANTLGYYGVEPGAYLYLPVTGATTVRDLIGNGLDQFVLPVAVGRPFNTPEYAIPYFVISSLDARLEVDAELARIDATIDPYAARRDSYLYRRERDIAELRGEDPPPRLRSWKRSKGQANSARISKKISMALSLQMLPPFRIEIRWKAPLIRRQSQSRGHARHPRDHRNRANTDGQRAPKIRREPLPRSPSCA